MGENGIRDRSPIGQDRRDNRRDGPRRSTGGVPRRGPSDKRVYVSNITWETKWQEIKDLFKEKVGNVKFVEMFNDEKGRSRGCGIVEFEDTASAKQAIETMDRYSLNGREIVVKEDFDVARDDQGRIIKGGSGGDRGRDNFSANRSFSASDRNSSFDRRDDNMRLGNTDPASKYGNTYGLNVQFLESLGIDGPLVSKVFVANLDYKVDEKKLKEVFKLAGKVVSAELNKDKEGNSRGHGTVEYEHPVEAVQAISMFKDMQLFDRKMSCRMDVAAVKEEKMGAPTKLPAGLKGIGMGLGAGGAPLKNVLSNLPSQNSNNQQQSTPSGLGNLGNNLGSVASLQSAQSILAAAQLSNTIGLGSGLGNNSFGGLGNSSGLGGLGGLNSSRVDPFQNNSRNVGRDAVVVKNLPPQYTWQTLREKFSNIGEVVFAEMRETGVGVVRFASEKDAERAVNLLDRTRIDNYTVDVYLY